MFPSTHVLTEDVVYREVTTDRRLLSRRLLMKTNRLPRWAERFFPAGMSRYVYILEDSILDPVNRSLTTYTWNLNHTTLLVRPHCLWKAKGKQKNILLHVKHLSLESSISELLFYWVGTLFSLPVQSVEERCVFLDSAEQPATTQLKREAWISSSIFGFSKPIQVHLPAVYLN